MPVFVVMGVSGCGKSQIGRKLADAVGGRFIDGDDLHPQENIVKMSEGIPLTDADRLPWLAQVGEALRDVSEVTFIACSALKRSYRERIIAYAHRPVTFLFLQGTPELLRERMAHREGHFMPTALLDSQLETLEPPEPDERAFAVSIDQTPEQIVAALQTFVRKEIA